MKLSFLVNFLGSRTTLNLIFGNNQHTKLTTIRQLTQSELNESIIKIFADDLNVMTIYLRNEE